MKRSRKNTVEHFRTDAKTGCHWNKTDLSQFVVFFHPDYTVGFGVSPNLLKLNNLSSWAC